MKMNLPKELTVFLKKIQHSRSELNEIEVKNTVLRSTYEECLEVFNQKKNQHQFQQKCKEISTIIKETTTSILIIEQEINKMKEELQKETNSIHFRLKQNHIGVLSKRLYETIKQTRSLQEEIKSNLKIQYEKEVSSMKRKSIPQEYQTIKPKKEHSFIQEMKFKREISKESLKKQNGKILSYVKQKHDYINEIVNSIDNLSQMMLDIKLLVDEQSLMINNIVDNCEQAQEYTQQSVEQIQSSKQLHKQRKIRQIIIYSLIGVILLCVGVLLLSIILPLLFQDSN